MEKIQRLTEYRQQLISSLSPLILSRRLECNPYKTKRIVDEIRRVGQCIRQSNQ